MDEIAVLIPCYNEGITIAKVILDAKKYLPNATFTFMTITARIILFPKPLKPEPLLEKSLARAKEMLFAACFAISMPKSI